MTSSASLRRVVSPARPVAVLLAMIVAFALAIFTVTPASAHIDMQGAEPPADAVVEVAPSQVVVLFSGEVSEAGSTLTVTGPDGQAADNGDGRLDLADTNRRTMTATLRPNLPTGVYTVSYSAFPADGHEAAAGSYTFTVGADVVPAAATPGATPVATPAGTPASTPIAVTGGPAASTSDAGTSLSPSNIALLIAAALAVVLGGGFAVTRASRRH